MPAKNPFLSFLCFLKFHFYILQAQRVNMYHVAKTAERTVRDKVGMGRAEDNFVKNPLDIEKDKYGANDNGQQ